MYHIPWFIFRRKRQIWVYHGIPCLTHTHTWFLDDFFTQSCPDGTVFFYHETSIGFTQNHLFGDDYIYICIYNYIFLIAKIVFLCLSVLFVLHRPGKMTKGCNESQSSRWKYLLRSPDLFFHVRQKVDIR